MTRNVVIRNLGVQDLPEIVSVHMAGFSDSALTNLGPEAVYRYYQWQLTGPHKKVAALGAFVDDKAAGFCFGGLFQAPMAGFVRKNRGFLIRRIVMHPWLITNPIFRERLALGIQLLKRFRKVTPGPVDTTLKDSSDKAFAILAIAVDPQYQGLGVGKRLMKKAEEMANEWQFQQMRLSVHPENHQAVGFYKSLGWEEYSDNGVWNGKMIKPLTIRN
jgi:ribosomal protein S18 acetylase RimI-like enzyme